MTTITTSHSIVSGPPPPVIKAAKNATHGHHRKLSIDYYAKTCPEVEKLVASVTSEQFKAAPAIASATIRLFFHDCFGCDASILISSKLGSKELAERDASQNKNLPIEAFEGINKAKALVEGKCLGVVSCTDILTISTRDYVHLAGGPYYEVKKGKWDGKISKASRVPSNIPHTNATVDELLKLFNSKGLNMEDLVVLSGAHTIGYSHCKYIINRIYNYKGTKQPQPNIDPKLLQALRMYCPHHGGNEDIVVPFDVTTPYTFDHAYYGNLEKNMGILITDQALYLDPRTKPIVQSLSKDKQKFFKAFAQAMEKMGNIHLKRGRKHGEMRKDCSSHM
uniref:Peroxidase n=1 Tax=Chenopodium quinoa TaxID=63459 RepID=A0A803LLS2_CHEQI